MPDNGTPNTVQEIADALAEFNKAHFGLRAEITIAADGLSITMKEARGGEGWNGEQWNEMKIWIPLVAWTTAIPDLLKMELDRMAARMLEASDG